MFFFFFKLRDKGYVILLGFKNVVNMIEKEYLHQYSVQEFFVFFFILMISKQTGIHWICLHLKCILGNV